ncbi:MAG: DUF362 domain-containing protein, partial [Candidatus Omnitrophica bacterium]|nr:DUF362 domain-containing protein [Candidatus Omnitrophota bacterium]
SVLKQRKTRPFLFDTSVIYKGQRQNAVDHLTLANNKGFGYSRVGAPFIIADGPFGADGREYHIKSKYISKIKTPSFVGTTDSVVVLSHVTGHILSGFAAAIKNVAMGMCCKPTKQVQHSSVKPSVFADKCTSCGSCLKICPVEAISWKDRKAFIDKNICIGCGECLCACNFDAVSISFEEEVEVFCSRIAETAGFIMSKFKNRFFINFALDITKECDCISSKNDEIISRDLGILASTDMVSVDKATVDLVNKEKDVFLEAQDKREYHGMLEHAAKAGFGNLEYNLKSI